MPDDYQDYDVYTNDTGNEPLPSLGSGDYGSADPDARRKQLRQLYQGPASQRYQDLLSQGAPALPQPKLWQRIAAGAMGAAAGAHDASGLRIGGRPAPSLMPEAMNAAANVQGVTDYNRQTQDYMRKIGIAQKGAAEERQSQMDAERAYSDDLRDKETQARLGLIKSQQDYFHDIRGQQEKDREERTRAREAQNIAQVEEKGGQFVPPSTTTSQPVPSGIEGLDLPGVSVTAPTPPSNAPGVKGAGYTVAPSMPGQPANTTLYMPTQEQTQAVKQGMQPVPEGLKDFFGGQDVAPAADIKAAMTAKAASDRAAATQSSIDERQAAHDASLEAARAKHDQELERLKVELNNSAATRSQKLLLQREIAQAQSDFERDVQNLNTVYGRMQDTNVGSSGLFGLGSPKKTGKLTPAQQTQRDNEYARAQGRMQARVQSLNDQIKTLGSEQLPPTVGSVVPRPKVAAPPGSTNETDPGGVTGRTPGTVRSAGPPNAPSKSQRFTSQGKTYNIPADQVAEFLKARPDAKPLNP